MISNFLTFKTSHLPDSIHQTIFSMRYAFNRR